MPPKAKLDARPDELRRQAEALQAQNRRVRQGGRSYRRFFNDSPQPVLIYDVESLAILSANEAAVDLYGFTPAQFLKLTITDLLPPEDLPALLEHLQQPQGAASRKAVDLRHRRRDGSVFPVRMFLHDFVFAERPARLVFAEDITEERRVEAMLRESEARFRTIADFTCDWECWAAPDGQFIYCSPSCERILGRKPAEFLADPDLFPRLIHPEDRAAHDCHVHHCERARRPCEAEWRVRRSDDTYRWLAHACQPVFDAAGNFLGVRSSNRDITERKAAEAALRASEERLQIFIQHAPGALAMFNREMRYLAVSQRWLQDYGLTGTILGRSHYEVFPEIPESWKAMHRRALAGETLSSARDRFARADGSIQWLKWEVQPWRTAAGDVGGIIIASEDVTARQETENALRYQLNLTRNITENTAAAIFITDPDGRITFVNQEAVATFGFLPDELIGERLHDRLHHHYPDGRPFPMRDCALTRIFSSGETVRNREEVFFHKDGTPINVACSIGRLQLEGEGHRAVIVLHDITARKRAEDELRRSRDELERCVAERTGELAASNEWLRVEIADRTTIEQALRRQAGLLDMASDAIFAREYRGAIHYWSGGAQRLYGFTADEALGHRSFEVLQTECPAGMETIQAALEQAGVWSGELTQTTKAGRKIIVECHMQRVDQPDGTQLVLETNHDITARLALEEAMVAAGERERLRLGRDLHDGLCQLLTASRLKIDSLAARLAVRAPTEVGAAKATLRLLTEALEEASRLARGLEPVAPVPEGLMVALQTLADATGKLFNVACSCVIPEPVLVFDPKAATALFRITQEAINNAIKHGQASSIRIGLTSEHGTLILTVASDGKPFPRRPGSRGTGLKSMHYRARRIPGTLEIGPGAGGGTLVRCIARPAPAQSPCPDVDALSPAHQMVLSAARSGRTVGEPPNPSKSANL